MKNTSDLFVGVTTYNSELWIPLCLESLKRTVPHASVAIVDNGSVDKTTAIARDYGVRVTHKLCSQPDALNILLGMADRPYTLLIHADVVLMSPRWFEVVKSKLKDGIILASPEDIGCGPYTRPWGKDKPESSFLFFSTKKLAALRDRQWYLRWGIPLFRRQFDFYGDHITYNIPLRLIRSRFDWAPMSVHVSDNLAEPYYVPDFDLPRWHWKPELGYIRYGLGNFYSINGVVTHYHNWYDRKIDRIKFYHEKETLESNGQGLPVAYLQSYTSNFIDDYRSDRVVIPTGLSI
jgi:glycosyltransferase involved in cell wall biosynthesis